jgi:predicted nuclease of predicted toxin-antitoxin system
MKFLVDANLPPKLCSWLNLHKHDARHLEDVGLLKATDSELWATAKDADRVIISKDHDFYDKALLLGPPPKVFHIDIGNASNKKLIELIEGGWSGIERALLEGCRLISLRREGAGEGKPIISVF